MLQVAVYGKGGIGKSTISSNLSYSIAKTGRKVLQIGCDPKHDSTKYLIGGQEQTTVLDYVRVTPPSKRKLGDIMITGAEGVMCVEAGGPEPGIGCAGRGILTTFDNLDKMGIRDVAKDITLYDVLGDVVCGGFAVPMRNEYADAVYIVTSGEFMAMYAANNILRGLLNFGNARPRVAGLILNRRNVDNERELVEKFSKVVGLPIVVDIPRSREYIESERLGKTVSEAFPDSVPAGIFAKLAEDVIAISEGKRQLYEPHPLSDAQLNELAAGNEIATLGNFTRKKCGYIATRRNTGSCSSRGACYAADRVVDMPIIVHGPDTCAFVMSHTRDVHFLSEITTNPSTVARLRDNVWTTAMTNGSSIFGGHEDLKRMIRGFADKGKKIIFVITTCVPGMIGDNFDLIKKQMEEEYPGLNLVVCKADGNLTGGSTEGRLMALKQILGLIDEKNEPVRKECNIIDDNFVIYTSGKNNEWVEKLLGQLGFGRVHKIIDNVKLEEVLECKKNILSIRTFDEDPVNMMAGILEEKGMKVFPLPLPRGYAETMEWLDRFGKEFGIEARAKEVADRATAEYKAALAKHRPFFEGKTVDLVTSIFMDDDWLVGLFLDVGAIVRTKYIMKVRVDGPVIRDRPSRYEGTIKTVRMSNPMEILMAVQSDTPDIVLGGGMIGWYGRKLREFSMNNQCFTHYASIQYLDYIHNLLLSAPVMGWRTWGGADHVGHTGADKPPGFSPEDEGKPLITDEQIEKIKAMMGGTIPPMMEAGLKQLKEGKIPEGMPPHVLGMIKSMTGGR